MKKILATICAVCALASLAVFAACDDGSNDTSADSSSSTVSSSIESSSSGSSSSEESSSSENSSSEKSSSEESSSVAIDYQISLNTTEAVVFTATSDVLTITDSTSLKDYLDALAAAGQIAFDGYTSTYGYYITSVNGVAEQAEYNADYTSGSGWSWMVYTNLYELDSVTYATKDYGEYTYGGLSMGQASYGVSLLPCVEGYSYALVYEAWSY